MSPGKASCGPYEPDMNILVGGMGDTVTQDTEMSARVANWYLWELTELLKNSPFSATAS